MPFRLTTIAPIEQLPAIVTVPDAAPATVGSNCTLRVALCPGFSDSGIDTPDILNPVPVSAAALTVAGAVPVELIVTVCVAGVFRFTFPKVTLLVLRVSVDTAAFSCNPVVAETPPAVAVSVAVCALLTAVAVAVNPALAAPAATVTEAGTVTALLLLVRLTAVPLVAADVSFTVQAAVPAPVSDALPHETALSVAGARPVPLSAIVAVPEALLPEALLLEALLLIVTSPLTAPAAVGSNPIVTVAVWPGVRSIGAPIPDTENPAPVAVAPLRISSAVPVDVTVTVLLIAVFSGSFPNATPVALRLSPADTAFNCSA